MIRRAVAHHVVVGVVSMAFAACGGGGSRDSTTSSSGASSTTRQQVSRTSDVSLTTCVAPPGKLTPYAQAGGFVTNSSTQRSDYTFRVSYEDERGDRITTSDVIVEPDLEPGQAAPWSDSTAVFSDPLPSTLSCRIIAVRSSPA